MKNFKKLKIWQKGMEIVYKTYELASMLPSDERFGLKSQITRSAVSIPSNIAEGSAKTSSKDNKKFLETSLGSAYELETQLMLIDKLQLGESELSQTLLGVVDEEQRMISAFIRKLGSE